MIFDMGANAHRYGEDDVFRPVEERGTENPWLEEIHEDLVEQIHEWEGEILKRCMMDKQFIYKSGQRVKR